MLKVIKIKTDPMWEEMKTFVTVDADGGCRGNKQRAALWMDACMTYCTVTLFYFVSVTVFTLLLLPLQPMHQNKELK